MTGTSAAVQATCRRSPYRLHRTAGRKAEYGRFSVLLRLEIYRNLRIKDSVKIDCAVDHGGFLMPAVELLGLRRWIFHALATRIRLRQWLLIPAGYYKEEGQRLICSR